MKRNILIFEDSSKARFGGGQKITLEVLAFLRDKYTLYLFDCHKKTEFNNRAKKFVDDIKELFYYGKIIDKGQASFSIGLMELLLTPFLTFINLFKLYIYCRKNGFNSENTGIYASTNKGLLQAYLINKLLGIKFLFHEHTYPDKSRIYYKMKKIMLKQAEIIICVSQTIKDYLGFPQCEVIYNCVDIQKNQKPKNLKKPTIVATFSTLTKWKGISFFIKSYEYIKNNVCFMVFGEGKDKDKLKKMVEKGQNIIFRDFVADIEKVLKDDIDIVVVPSIAEESFSLVAAESFSLGIPVITTNIGAQKEIVIDEYVGFNVPIKDSKAIAEKIDYLIDNPDIYNKFSNNALEHVQKFNRKDFQNKIQKVFAKIF